MNFLVVEWGTWEDRGELGGLLLWHLFLGGVLDLSGVANLTVFLVEDFWILGFLNGGIFLLGLKLFGPDWERFFITNIMYQIS